MSDPSCTVVGMSEHTVSIEELRKKIGNAVLLAATRNCRFVITRYGTAMGAVVGYRDLQRLKKLDEGNEQAGAEGAAAAAAQIEKERYEALVVSIADRMMLGEEVNPATPEEWEIFIEIGQAKARAKHDAEARQIIAELTEAAKARRAEMAAA
jgi:hypothetical protein